MVLKTHLVSGIASYCKILGTAPPGYDNGPAEWTFDLILDKEGVEKFLSSGADKFYVRTNKETGDQFVRFTRKAIKKDGSKGKPFVVEDAYGEEWDQTELIGNGSQLNVRFSLNQITHKGQTRLKPSALAVQVWEHKKFKKTGDFDVKEKPVEASEDW
jgi:hypothetical protein